jgi:hypothetical protein
VPATTSHIFLLSTGFHYYFSELLIEYLQLENVAYAMYQPREGIQNRAGAKYPVVFNDGSDFATRLSKKLGKLEFARRVFNELDLAGKNIKVYSPYYNETFVNRLRELIARHGGDVEYNMIPDGAALLRHLPKKEDAGGVLKHLTRHIYKAAPGSFKHKSGSYSDFLKTIYHFPAKKIYAPEEKIAIVPFQPSDKTHNGEILIIGGLRGISREFVMKAIAMSEGYTVKYRMHPKNRNGLEYILKEAPHWQELSIPDGSTLEEYLLDTPYYKVMGYYSSALMFNDLFVAASQSEFLLEAASEDLDWRATADACGIPVTLA